MELEALRTKWAGLLPPLDAEEIAIMNAVICNEGSTMYRLSRVTGLAISSAYRKTASLARRGLVRVERRGRTGTCRSTLKGLLDCFARGCVDDGYVLGRISSMFRNGGIEVGSQGELLALLSIAADSLASAAVDIRQPRDLVLSVIGHLMADRRRVGDPPRALVLGIIRDLEELLK